MLTVSSDVDRFNQTLKEYIRVTGKTPAEAVFKQGVKVGWELRKRLLELKPGKGEIKQLVLGMLERGQGIKVREAARKFATGKSIATYSKLSNRKAGGFMEVTKSGKLKKGGRNWWHLAVHREIGYRESGRGYSGFAVRPKIPSMKAIGKITSGTSDNWKLFGRYRQYLTNAGLKSSPGTGTFTYTWGGLDKTTETGIGDSMSKGPQQAALRASLREVDRDMKSFIRDEYKRNARRILKTR